MFNLSIFYMNNKHILLIFIVNKKAVDCIIIFTIIPMLLSVIIILRINVRLTRGCNFILWIPLNKVEPFPFDAAFRF